MDVPAGHTCAQRWYHSPQQGQQLGPVLHLDLLVEELTSPPKWAVGSCVGPVFLTCNVSPNSPFQNPFPCMLLLAAATGS